MAGGRQVIETALWGLSLLITAGVLLGRGRRGRCVPKELWKSATLAPQDDRRNNPTADCSDWAMVGVLSFAAGAIILLVWILRRLRIRVLGEVKANLREAYASALYWQERARVARGRRQRPRAPTCLMALTFRLQSNGKEGQAFIKLDNYRSQLAYVFFTGSTNSNLSISGEAYYHRTEPTSGTGSLMVLLPGGPLQKRTIH